MSPELEAPAQEDEPGRGTQGRSLPLLSRIRPVGRGYGAETAVEVLRVGIGVIWALNLCFILDPSAQYLATFPSVAAGYGPSTLGGPGLANFVVGHSLFFAWLIALATGYLAVAFILGITTRLAILVGAISSVGFFVTQFWTTFMLPGGTDVGAHPLYLVIYLALFLGGAGRKYSVDHLLFHRLGGTSPRSNRGLPTRLFAWIGTYLPGGLPAREGGVRALKPRGGGFAPVVYLVGMVAVIGGLAFAAGYGIGLGPDGVNSNPGGSGMTSPPGAPFYVTLAINSVLYHNSSAQQCTPANFTVPSHTLLIFVIKNFYPGIHPVTSPYGTVSRTVGAVEYLNGSQQGVGSLPASKVSQTFSIPVEGSFPGINVPIPAAGQSPSVVQFLAYFNETGPEVWMTMAPTDATSMMTPGLMMGTMAVV